MDAERDAINPERLAIIGAKYLAILEKSAQKFHVMLKSECIANVDTDTSMQSASLLLKEIPSNAMLNAGSTKEIRN